MAFKVLCVDHVGVAVKDLALIKQQMKDILGLDPSCRMKPLKISM